MGIVFIGAVEFSRHCLLEVLRNQGEVVAIVTAANPERNHDHFDLSPIAHEHAIPVLSTSDINASSTIAWICDLKLDIAFCWGLSQIVKPELLSIQPLGFVRWH